MKYRLISMVLTVVFFAACHGENATPERWFIQVGDSPFADLSLSVNATDESWDEVVSTDDGVFEIELYDSAEMQDSLFGPVALEVFDADQGLYVADADVSVVGGELLVLRRRHVINDGAVIERSLTLYSAELTVTASETSFDLTSASWEFRYDEDGDELTNLEEILSGTDPVTADTDVDGVRDDADAFPTDSNASFDEDGDGIADEADNCPLALNASQTDNDLNGIGDACEIEIVVDSGMAVDSDGDGVADDADAFLGDAAESSDSSGIEDNAVRAVFVSENGVPANSGLTATAPLPDLATAAALAATLDYDVYVAAGSYDVSDADFSSGVSIYGGYSSDFESRDVSHEIYPTNFYGSPDAEGIVVKIQNTESPITLSGFILNASGTDSDVTLIAVSNADAVLENLELHGNSEAERETFLELSAANAEIQSVLFAGEARQTSVGLHSENAIVILTNSIFDMGEAENTTALALDESQFIAVNNTIDGGRHASGSSYGAVVTASQATFVNNIFVTENFDNQASVRCTGASSEVALTFENNLFLRYSEDSLSGAGNGYHFPAYVTCEGRQYLTTSSELASGLYSELTSVGSLVSETTDFYDDAEGFAAVFGEGYALSEGSPAIDAGGDASAYNVSEDYYGTIRFGDYDLGAVETAP